MKKFLSVLTIGFILLNAAACNNEGESVEGPEEINVGVAIYQYDDNFMTLYRGEIERYFDELSNEEVEYKVTVTDGKNDQGSVCRRLHDAGAGGTDPQRERNEHGGVCGKGYSRSVRSDGADLLRYAADHLRLSAADDRDTQYRK